MLNRWSLYFATMAFLLVLEREASAVSAGLAWDANPEAEVTGYKLYYGSSSRVYTNIIDVGLRTTYTLSNLVDGAAYYLALTAYTSSGLESDFSEEVVFDGAERIELAVSLASAGQYRVRVLATPGRTYSIEYTERLDVPLWQVLANLTANSEGVAEILDNPANSTRRFYRAVSMSSTNGLRAVILRLPSIP